MWRWVSLILMMHICSGKDRPQVLVWRLWQLLFPFVSWSQTSIKTTLTPFTTTWVLPRGKVINKHNAHPHPTSPLFSQIYFPNPFLLDMGLPDQLADTCPLLPSLEQALGVVEELAGAGAGARQAHYIHVTEVTLPMLCSYMSRWWHWGPEGELGFPLCTSVTPHHASALLGHILHIIHNHVGASQGDWMKQLAGIVLLAYLYTMSIMLLIPPLSLMFNSYMLQYFLSQSYSELARSCWRATSCHWWRSWGRRRSVCCWRRSRWKQRAAVPLKQSCRFRRSSLYWCETSTPSIPSSSHLWTPIGKATELSCGETSLLSEAKSLKSIYRPNDWKKMTYLLYCILFWPPPS